MHTLHPNGLCPAHNGHFENDEYTFFWNGPFSNWYPSEFTIDETTYNCAEQAMMHKKALFFNDTETANKIMKADHPKEQKALGRSVANYVEEEWAERRLEIVIDILIHKFEDKALRKILLETENRFIVEASPYDEIWGIKMGVNDPDILDSKKWRGQNLLGKALMGVRAYYAAHS